MGFDADRFMAWKPTEADKARARHTERGKLLPRERVSRLAVLSARVQPMVSATVSVYWMLLEMRAVGDCADELLRPVAGCQL